MIQLGSQFSGDRTPIGVRDQGTEGRGRVALVTGASSGIGLALSRLLAAKGYSLALIARREDRLMAITDELAARWRVDVLPLVVDLSEPGAVKQILRSLSGPWWSVDFLVNNAGYSQIGCYHLVPWADHEQRLRVMGSVTLELTHGLLPDMVDRRWGRIINIGSMASLYPATPGNSMYGSIKAMVRNFSEAIDAEYRPYGVHCTVAHPGPTDTEMLRRSGYRPAASLSRHLEATGIMSATTVARASYVAVMRGRPRLLPGLRNRRMGFVLTYAPMRVRRQLALKHAPAVVGHRLPRPLCVDQGVPGGLPQKSGEEG